METIAIWVLSAGCLFQCDIEKQVQDNREVIAIVQACADNPDGSTVCNKVEDASTNQVSNCLAGYAEYCRAILK